MDPVFVFFRLFFFLLRPPSSTSIHPAAAALGAWARLRALACAAFLHSSSAKAALLAPRSQGSRVVRGASQSGISKRAVSPDACLASLLPCLVGLIVPLPCCHDCRCPCHAEWMDAGCAPCGVGRCVFLFFSGARLLLLALRACLLAVTTY
ncbi:uncharacterized protein K452DRAFT_677 [Aplosporella prunicola CBS 121167]|uniref:Uncharacterized protein n=1 Tax=Aplosporella prunicola CBS 121167 TaxID=1176127 RepID=A0A6A6BWF4_9PEZI|nr:uncharacterized protein K452DRAFT_677 [Aplosporella prunicola CBS 121167]KAF2147041.1 hypothetical protein K452DRAFT_677 [Aplosporella prunicola CBS 121167]